MSRSNLNPRFVATHCHNDIAWLQEPGQWRPDTGCQGHKPRREGHRRVSGIVRAGMKEESHNMVKEEL